MRCDDKFFTSFDDHFEEEGLLGEGTFSQVYKVRKKDSGEFYAAKRLLREFPNMNEVNNCDELNNLKKLAKHDNVVSLFYYVYESEKSRLTLMFDLMESSLYDYIKDRKGVLPEWRCKNFLYQLTNGLCFLHKNNIIHRDIKPENCLLKSTVTASRSGLIELDVVKLADLGSMTYSDYRPPLSEYVSTRWYRAPECILSKGFYGPKMDIWALGCVFYEILTNLPLFPGESEIDQLDKIHRVVGTPSIDVLYKFENTSMALTFQKHQNKSFGSLLPTTTVRGLDVLRKMLTYHPENRISAKQLYNHVYFAELRPENVLKPMKPNLRTQSMCEIDHRKSAVENFLSQIKQNEFYHRERQWNSPIQRNKKTTLKHVQSCVPRFDC